jgi:PilZ domain
MSERRRSGRFDKAFTVHLSGERGMARGIARNISSGGMFIETASPFALGSRVVVTFSTAEGLAEIAAQAEVRYQCALEFGGSAGRIGQLRGVGVRFLSFETSEAEEEEGQHVLH